MAKHHQFAFKGLDVYQAAVEHFDWTCRVVQRMPKGPFKVVDQAVSASLSVMGNIGEAHGRESKAGEIEQHYRYVQGSTFESATHLDAFSALGVITDDDYNAEENRLARIAMMLTRLVQKQRRRRTELRSAARRGSTTEKTEAMPREVEGQASSNPSAARPGARSRARFESPRSGVSEAASAAEEIEHRP